MEIAFGDCNRNRHSLGFADRRGRRPGPRGVNSELDGDHNARRVRKRCEHAHEGRRDRARLRRLIGVCPKEGGCQGALLDRRQGLPCLLEVRPDEIRERCVSELNLGLGRPSEVQLLFGRRITRRTPGRFQTRIVTDGVLPSLHITYKHCGVKQYFKEGRALRTETTINDAYDFGVGRWLTNFATLQAIGRQLNTRLLEHERVAHDCGMSRAELADLLAPGCTPEGQPAPGLRFGQPRITALLQALCLFALTPAGITNGCLRPLVGQLLGLSPEQYTARQMGYDLRRLARKGLIRRVNHQLRYELTPAGRRIALFLATLEARVLRPGLQALDTRIVSTAPPPLRVAMLRFDREVERLAQQAHLAA